MWLRKIETFFERTRVTMRPHRLHRRTIIYKKGCATRCYATAQHPCMQNATAKYAHSRMNLYTAINYKTRKTEADSCALLVAKNVVAKNVVAKNATKTK